MSRANRIVIDTDSSEVTVIEGGVERKLQMADPAAFEAVSKAWLRVGWDAKHVYTFTWLGRPIIQLPEDLLRIQEVIYAVKPTLIIETGVAHGGSLIFYAGLFEAMKTSARVIGIDIEIRLHNRRAIEEHELFARIQLIEGSSVAPAIVAQVKSLVRADDRVMVILDSNHTKAHVLAELEAYAPFVSAGSYIVATDGIMQDLVGAPRSQPDWSDNNPAAAADEFAASHPEFEHQDPPFAFNEGSVRSMVTYWPRAWLRRRA